MKRVLTILALLTVLATPAFANYNRDGSYTSSGYDPGSETQR